MWNPDQYQRFSEHRSRPFFDLITRIDAPRAKRIADLGCGPGNLTAHLSQRWSASTVIGVDNSVEMLEKAKPMTRMWQLEFELADLATWQPREAQHVIVSNAALQWVPNHEILIPRLASLLEPDGWLAIQMPNNFDQNSHLIINHICSSPRWAAQLRQSRSTLRQPQKLEWYIAQLSRLGFQVDAWETNYQHILPGENAVLEWVKGTALRPMLAVLKPEDQTEFLEECRQRLLEAYPPHSFGTLLPFKRVFFVAHKPA
jgi:trans-aconitate 2-methyltransferase